MKRAAQCGPRRLARVCEGISVEAVREEGARPLNGRGTEVRGDAGGVNLIKVAFYDAKAYDRPSFEHYGALHDMQFRFLETKLNEDTAEFARGCDAVCVFVNDNVNREGIDRRDELGVKLIARRSAGYNNVDVRAAFGKIHVVHVPAYSPYAVAEHAMALLLTSVRRIHKAYNRTREFNFSLNGLTGFDLHGKTAGVIGTGRIGRIFIDICRGFGMNVIAYDSFPAKDSGIEYVSLDELFERSDVISLHCPLTDGTRHMINAEAIGKMKKGVVILNTSRGGLIDAEALNNIAETTVRNIISCFENDGVCDNELCYRCGNIERCKKERKEKCF